jgi:diadenosine tetraphosphate (Ap4A) HIT family hydrolase
MDEKEYADSCLSCAISRGSILLHGGIIELPGKWILSHYDSQESFLGWMALQPRYHRMGLIDLPKDEVEALGVNIQNVEMALRQFWALRFAHDPIERVYVAHLSESKDLHLNLHLIPRTSKLGRGDPAEHTGWRIFELTESWDDFPHWYRIRDKQKRWARINTERVTTLMTHLRGYFWQKSFGN